MGLMLFWLILSLATCIVRFELEPVYNASAVAGLAGVLGSVIFLYEHSLEREMADSIKVGRQCICGLTLALASL